VPELVGEVYVEVFS